MRELIPNENTNYVVYGAGVKGRTICNILKFNVILLYIFSIVNLIPRYL